MEQEQFDLTGEKEKRAPRKGGCFGLIFFIGFVIVGCAVIIQIITIIEGGMWFIPGDPQNFDPIENYQAVADHAGNNVYLTEIRAQFVRRDGTLELGASYEPSPEVTYTFYRITGEVNNAPQGVQDSDAVTYREVSVFIRTPFEIPFYNGGDSFQFNPGMDRYSWSERTGVPPQVVPVPTCSFYDLWTDAIELEDANRDAVARITYDIDGYNFRIDGTNVRLEFDHNCNVID